MRDGIIRQKRSLRFLLRARRRVASLENADAASALCDVFISNIAVPLGCVVGFYYAMGSEMSCAPIVRELAARGHVFALPCIEEIDGLIDFRLYKEGDALEAGAFSIPQPLSSSPRVEPDFFLVPLLGFDRRGRRIGQGGGYYDRLFAVLEKKKTFIKVGVAYAEQEVAEIPSAEHDQNLDAIVTEKEFIDPAA